MRSCVLWLLLFSGCAAIVFAQQSSADKTAPTSTVSGHVYCADTNAPARMATVMLEPAEAADAHQQGRHDHASTYASAVQTLLDGSFSIPHVAPGTYYVIASVPGYVSPLSALGISAEDIQKPDDTLRNKIANTVPRILVQQNLPVAIDVTIERGAAVSGTVLFGDGSPAGGLEVHLLIRKKDKWVYLQYGPNETAAQTRTDDRGVYRISGLPAREFLVEVDLQLNKMTYEFGAGGSGTSTEVGYSLPIYSGNIWRKKDATPVSLRSGEDRAGEDIQIPISKLHTVRGSITAARDGHTINGGSVSLLHADDKSEAARASLTKDDNVFAFSFVPEGDYILHVAGAADLEYEEIPNPPHSVPQTRTEVHTLHIYGSTDQALHIDGDLPGLTVAVPELPVKQAQANP